MNIRVPNATLASLLVLLVGCSSALLVLAPQDDPPQTIADLKSHPVIGSLGVPLGTVAEIQATVVAGRELGDKAHDGSYVLRVATVNGKALDRPVVMDFVAPGFVNVQLASGEFDLYKLKNGKEAHGLDQEQIAELERGYVGRQARIAVHETGPFAGIPRGLPPDAPVWQDRSFGFSSHLVVLAECKDPLSTRDRAHD